VWIKAFVAICALLSALFRAAVERAKAVGKAEAVYEAAIAAKEAVDRARAARLAVRNTLNVGGGVRASDEFERRD
jgi:hypothetical protein